MTHVDCAAVRLMLHRGWRALRTLVEAAGWFLLGYGLLLWHMQPWPDDGAPTLTKLYGHLLPLLALVEGGAVALLLLWTLTKRMAPRPARRAQEDQP